MKKEGHKAKAEEIKESLQKLLPDPEGRNVVAVVELTYGIAQHLVAAGMQSKYNEHLDTHVGLPRALRNFDEDKIANLFERLDSLRQGRWYGSRGNGDIVKECLEMLNQIERWVS